MRTWLLLLIASATVACSSAGPEEQAGDDVYTLDLSAFPRGVSAANDIAVFPIDLAQRSKKITALAPDQIVAVYTRRECWQGVTSGLEDSVGGARVPAGDAAWVTSLDVAVLCDQGATQPSTRGVCFGYRTTDAHWHWSFDLVPTTLDAAAGVARAHLTIGAGPVDALAVLFDSVYHGGLQGVRFEARAASAR